MRWQQIDMAARMWNGGMSTAEIARKVGERECVVANQIEVIRGKAKRIRKGDAIAGGKPKEDDWED